MSSQQPQVGDALSRGWQAFTDRIADFLIVAVIAGLLQWSVAILLELLFGGVSFTSVGFTERTGVAFGTVVLATVVFFLVFLVITVVACAYYTAIALAGVDGEQVSFSEIGSRVTARFVPFVGWVLLLGLCVSAGTFVLVVGGLVAWFFLMLVPFYAMEGEGPDNPFVASGKVALSRTGEVLLLLLVGIGLLIGLVIIFLILRWLPLVGILVVRIAQFLVYGFYFCSIAAFYRMTQVGPEERSPEDPSTGA